MNQQSVRHLKLAEPQPTRDHIRGPADAPIKMLEYGDYECPYCGQAHPVVLAVKDELGDRLCFAFRNFPLANMHPHARQAAEAAEVAGAQGKFWEMHDVLFENQHALEAEDLVGCAPIHRRSAKSRSCTTRSRGFLCGRTRGSQWHPDIFHQWRAFRWSAGCRFAHGCIDTSGSLTRLGTHTN